MRDFCLRTFGAALGAILFIWLFSGCSHFTVAPKPVVARQIAFDENAQNAGIIDCDKSGCLVTGGWLAKYKAMEIEFTRSILADANIRSEGVNYRVSYECANHYAEMRASERGP